jgi:hypothetical protein
VSNFYRVRSKRDRLLMDGINEADQIVRTYRDALRGLTTLLQKWENEGAEDSLTENIRQTIREARAAIELWEGVMQGCAERLYFKTVEH